MPLGSYSSQNWWSGSSIQHTDIQNNAVTANLLCLADQKDFVFNSLLETHLNHLKIVRLTAVDFNIVSWTRAISIIIHQIRANNTNTKYTNWYAMTIKDFVFSGQTVSRCMWSALRPCKALPSGEINIKRSFLAAVTQFHTLLLWYAHREQTHTHTPTHAATHQWRGKTEASGKVVLWEALTWFAGACRVSCNFALC